MTDVVCHVVVPACQITLGEMHLDSEYWHAFCPSSDESRERCLYVFYIYSGPRWLEMPPQPLASHLAPDKVSGILLALMPFGLDSGNLWRHNLLYFGARRIICNEVHGFTLKASVWSSSTLFSPGNEKRRWRRPNGSTSKIGRPISAAIIFS